MDETGRFPLLKKAHHFFLRAVRCHLVIYFRVYPKITYQLPSLWHSRLSPHAMFVDTDGSPFGRTIKTAVFHSMVKVATRARNIPFWPLSCAVSFIYFWLWSLSHHVCDDHSNIFFYLLITLLLYYIFFALSSNLFIYWKKLCGEREITSLTHVQLRLRC